MSNKLKIDGRVLGSDSVVLFETQTFWERESRADVVPKRFLVIKCICFDHRSDADSRKYVFCSHDPRTWRRRTFHAIDCVMYSLFCSSKWRS